MRLQKAAHVWNSLTNVTSGSIAFHKCQWQLIAWELLNGDLELIQATEEELVMQDNKGAYAVIEFLPPDKPIIGLGLGYRLCPDGSQGPKFDHILEIM